MTLPRSTADDPARTEPHAPVCWGAYDVEQHQTRRWEVGPLVLLVERRVAEWRVGVMRTGDALRDALQVNAPVSPEELAAYPAAPRWVPADDTPPDTVRWTSYGVAHTNDALEVWPRLANLTRYPVRRLDLELTISHEEPLDRVRGVLMSVASEHPRALEHPAPRRALTGGAVAIGQPATVEGSRDPAA